MSATVDDEASAGAPRPEPGWAPYVAPYFAFLLIVQLQSPGWFDHSLLLRALQVVVPAALLVHYLRRGGFPELRGFRPGVIGVAADVALGLAIAALWIVPFEAGWLERPDDARAFDPDAFGGAWRDVVLGLRLAGYVVVTPFVEELFVRSFLIRAAELLHVSRRGLDVDFESDFRDLPVARFAWKGFVGTVLFFTFTHVDWQWPVAFVTGVVWNLWLYWRGHILPLVISHAVANGAIYLAVVTDGLGLGPALGRSLDLWYQL